MVPCVVYLEYEGRLSRMAVPTNGRCSYFALSNAFGIGLKPETIKVNGKR
jgi:hypothetical protein